MSFAMYFVDYHHNSIKCLHIDVHQNWISFGGGVGGGFELKDGIFLHGFKLSRFLKLTPDRFIANNAYFHVI